MAHLVARPASNFDFLAYHDPRLAVLGADAERLFAEFPVQCLSTLRTFGEILAQRAAAKVGVWVDAQSAQMDVLGRLAEKGALPYAPRELFHGLRVAGNRAAHEAKGDHHEALHQLKQARELAVWFQRSFGNNKKFDPGPFVPPKPPAGQDAGLADELAALRAAVEKSKVDLEAVRREVEDEAKKRLGAEVLAAQLAEQKALWEALAADADAALQAASAKHAAELAALQAAALAASPQAQQATIEQAAQAGSLVSLDEAATRRLIDAQLRAAGWEADSERLTESAGALPEKGRNRAIAEWRVGTGGDRADYVLFVGLEAFAVVEAKRSRKDVSQALVQAERYSRTWKNKGEARPPEGGPWGKEKLAIPFLFATNGRPRLAQIAEKSGIWFRDARRDENHGRDLDGWISPEGLVARMKQDIAAAHKKLAAEPTGYLGLRDYQVRAIRAVEEALARADGATEPASAARARQHFLVAMATGTGKTRTAIGLVYRLLKSKRFRRILFLVDRTSLGEQTANAFKDARLESLQTFTDIYNMKELADVQPDPDTKLQIATIQGLVRRILFAADPADTPPVDQYDCIVVDECHRGYGLDREMSDSELRFRDLEDYVSTFRRVLEHFDAVKIGLTATPALHTLQIFGEPTFRYGYREAVIDGHLIDHEPPVCIVTALGEDGIHWQAGSEVKALDPKTQAVDLVHLPDEVDVDIDSFNKRVLTESFNRVVCAELARHIDPNLPGKTLVFAATDLHADMLVRLLQEAFEAQHGSLEDGAVRKITGASDQPLQLIRRFKNERLPSVAVTVDLLSTGIDVPTICNIVFLRRVRSRILYEQMLGRATRLCPAIDKTTFRIFDAVDLYAALEGYTDMLPVVTAPNIPFAELVRELRELGQRGDEEAQRTVLEQLLAKLQRRRHTLKGETLGHLESQAGMSLAELVAHLKGGTPAAAASWFQQHALVLSLLDTRPEGGQPIYISEHEDSLRRTEHGYGSGQKPDDYLAGFATFVREHLNQIPALLVVTQRPRDLTRKQLKEVQLALDEAGYTEAKLRTAWHDKTNADIAASILGYVRQAALGDALIDYDVRVDRALAKILAKKKWTSPQRDWLTRIAKQIKREKIVDREAIDSGAFAAEGGFARIDKTFEGKLGEVLLDFGDALWKDAG